MPRYRKVLYSHYGSNDSALPLCDSDLSITEYQSESYSQNFQPLIPRDPSVRIVDLGCGKGAFLLWLITKGYANVVGVEQDAKQV